MASNENDGEIVRTSGGAAAGSAAARVRSESVDFRRNFFSRNEKKNVTDSSDESGGYYILTFLISWYLVGKLGFYRLTSSPLSILPCLRNKCWWWWYSVLGKRNVKFNNTEKQYACKLHSLLFLLSLCHKYLLLISQLTYSLHHPLFCFLKIFLMGPKVE